MSFREKTGLMIMILSLFIRGATFFPETESIAITISVVIFLAGWFLFVYGDKVR